MARLSIYVTSTINYSVFKNYNNEACCGGMRTT